MTRREYTVRIDPQRRIVMARADRSVLEAALDAGLNLPHSCKSGHCGSCRARLLSGEVRYPESRRPLGLMEEEERAGYVLLCQALPASDLAVEARHIANVAEVEIKTLPCRIERLHLLAPDVMQVFLRLPSVESLRFQPGQYIDVLLDDGRRRSFSIASPPHDSDSIELQIRRAGGGFSELLFTTLSEGSLLRIEGPVGQFVYRESDAPLLMVAGGTGFAPLKSMLRHMLERGVRRETHLYWGARTEGDVYERALVLDWVRRYPQLRFTAVLSEAGGGWVHEAALADHPDLSTFDVYVAGPPGLVETVRASYPGHGAVRLYFDSFDYAPPVALTSVG